MRIKHLTAREAHDALAVGNIRYDIAAKRRLRLVADVLFGNDDLSTRTETRVVFSKPWPKKKG